MTTVRPSASYPGDVDPAAPRNGAHGLRALVVDDEPPALSELAFLLGRDERVVRVRTAGSAAEALRALDGEPVDVVFSDIKMPGLDGLDLARVLARFTDRPQVVFVTAYDEHAVDAFEVQAADYVMKPVRPERLAEAVRRVLEASADTRLQSQPDETIAVELGGVTRLVQRSQVRYVEAYGDYARLHTDEASHLVRIPLTALEERWADAGFVRIHRSTLVSVQHIDEVRMDGARCVVHLGAEELQVSRRHRRELRDRLGRTARLAREP